MTLLASPVAYFHSLWLEYRMVASGEREWSWRQSAFQLSNVVFRDALWWKGRASVHRTMSLTILNNKDGVKKNGRNTGSCWTSERKERALFPCCSGKTSGRRWWLAQCYRMSWISVFRENKTFPCVVGWGGGMTVEAWASQDGWYLRDGGNRSICLGGTEGKTGNTESANCMPAVDTMVKCNGWNTFEY